MITGKPLTILLIDDSEDDGYLFGCALKEINPAFSYIHLRNGEDALRALKDSTLKPDYIFVDMFMPMLSGLEVLKQIKAMKELNNIPVITCSGVSYDTEIEEAKTLGAVFMAKPNSIDDLKAAISGALGGW